MSYENISVVIPPEGVQKVKDAVKQIETVLFFLVTLSSDEIRGMTKLGPKSLEFVMDCMRATIMFPDIFPTSFNAAEFHKDVNAFQVLSEIKILIDSLKERVDNTVYAIGNESMTQGLEVYAHVQISKERVAGLKVLAATLAERFKKNGLRKSPPKAE
jgi:hypothetical protein